MTTLNFGVVIGGLMCLGASTTAFPQANPIAPALVTPDGMRWVQFPGGASRTELVGDEKKAGLYAYRVKLPADFKRQGSLTITPTTSS